MGRGRQPKRNTTTNEWQYIFEKNVGTYFQLIIKELSNLKNNGAENGLDLLNKIKAEKKSKGIKEKDISSLNLDKPPINIPKNWIWCNLSEMCINRDGERKPISQSERDLKQKIYDYYGASGIIDKIDGYTHEGELLLIGEDGANLISRSTPIAFIAKGKYWVNNHAHVIETMDRITLDYLCRYINSIDLKPFVTGGFQPKLSQGNLNVIPIPLPPLSEQKNIVEFLKDFEQKNLKKDDEYFNYEIEKKIINIHKIQLIANTLISENNFQIDQIKFLNQAILQDAVQGKLVPQNTNVPNVPLVPETSSTTKAPQDPIVPKDSSNTNVPNVPIVPQEESVTELLKRIKAEKEKLCKKEKPLPVIKPEEIPFKIPDSWVWCRIDDILEFSKESLRRGPFGSSITKSMFVPKSDKNATKIYEQKNAIYKNYSLGNYYIDIEKNANLKSFITGFGDIIISCAGTIGEAYLIPKEAPAGIINQALLKIRLNENIILNAYFLEFFKAIIKTKVNSDAKGSAMKNLGSIKYLRENLLIPLPPLSEQKRIVAEIEKQLAKTKQLKEHIISNQQATEQLLKALLHQAFEVEETTE